MKRKLTILAFVLFPILAIIAKHDVISPILGIFWIFILIPACILYLIDWFRFNEGHDIVSKFGKIILRFPIALFGAVSILIGSSIILWVLYNIFIERQSEYTGPSTILGGFGIGPALIFFGIYMLRLAIKKQASKDNQELLIKPET